MTTTTLAHHPAAARSAPWDILAGLNRGTVTSLVDCSATVSVVLADLARAGIDRDSVEIIQLADNCGGSIGISGQIATWLSFFGPEREIFQQYQQGLDAGRLMLVIHARSRELRDRAAATLRTWGGHYIHDFGRFTVRLVAP